ncbi:MAG: hypothetical protein R3245_11510, partial [Kiloniellales bacterium]|nr:hypothetical protein [Kiloniellales bacterium]
MSDRVLAGARRSPSPILYPMAGERLLDWREAIESWITSPVVRLSETGRRRKLYRFLAKVKKEGRDLAREDESELIRQLHLIRHHLRKE